MKNRWIFQILVLVGVVFFTALLISRLFLVLSETPDQLKEARYLRASCLFFPLDHFSAYKYGFLWLDRGFKQKDNRQLERSMTWFKRSIMLNPFYHFAHHHLGKAFLFHNYPQSTYFEKGVSQLKTALSINQNNKFMVRDTSEVMFSLWPLLSEGDKQSIRELLIKFAPRFSWDEFQPLVELWWLYSREVPFMKNLLGKNPDFLAPVARMVVALKGPLNLRWQWLSDHENHLLREVIQRYRQGPGENESRLEFEKSLVLDLNRIKRYDRLVTGKQFNQERFLKHKIQLAGGVVREFINRHKGNLTPDIYKTVGQLVMDYLASGPELKDLLDLERFLEGKGFFQANDFASLYIKYRLKFSQAEFSGLIDEIETLKRSVSFVKEGHMADYVKLLLLLADAYEASKLLTVADTTLRDLLKMEPDNPEAWLGLVRIQQVLGDDDSERIDGLADMREQLKKSRFLTLNKFEQTFPVFLIDDKAIELSVEQGLLNRLEDQHIIQVFVDGDIRYEEYIEQLPELIRLDLKEAGEFVKVEVDVRFL